MPGLLIKELPDDLHALLRARARSSRRSMSSEAIVILEAALRDRAGPLPLAEIERLRIRGSRPLTDAILNEARETGRP